MNMIEASNNMSSKPTILFAAYQVDRGSNGGMESATQIFESLYLNYNWILFTNIYTSRSARWEQLGARVIVAQFPGFNQIEFFRYVWLLLTLCFKHADILHANDIFYARILSIISVLTLKKFAFTLRDTKINKSDYGFMWSFVLWKAEKLVFLSHEMESVFLSWFKFIKRNKCWVIPSYIDLTLFKPSTQSQYLSAKEKFGLAPNDICIGIVAGVFPKKNQLNFINYLGPFLRGTNIKVHIIGDYNPISDSYCKQCATALENLNLTETIFFHGTIESVSSFMHSVDIGLIVSVREGLARCMLEFLACGIPVVSTNVCSAHEYLYANCNGFLIEQGDWNSLLIALNKLANDQLLRKKLGLISRNIIKDKHSCKEIDLRWCSFYGISRP